MSYILAMVATFIVCAFFAHRHRIHIQKITEEYRRELEKTYAKAYETG